MLEGFEILEEEANCAFALKLGFSSVHRRAARYVIPRHVKGIPAFFAALTHQGLLPSLGASSFALRNCDFLPLKWLIKNIQLPSDADQGDLHAFDAKTGAFGPHHCGN